MHICIRTYEAMQLMEDIEADDVARMAWPRHAHSLVAQMHGLLLGNGGYHVSVIEVFPCFIDSGTWRPTELGPLHEICRQLVFVSHKVLRGRLTKCQSLERQ